jgi:phosphocarrier protein
MTELVYTIKNPVGLHATPAGHLSKLLQNYPDRVDITFKEQTVNAKKMFRVVSLGAVYGSIVKFCVFGAHEDEILEKLKKWIVEERL